MAAPRSRAPRPLLPADPAAAISIIERHLDRLYLEASDHRVKTATVPSLGVGATFTISNNLLKHTRNSRFLRLACAAQGAAAGSNLVVTLFAGGVAAGDRVFTLTLAGAGWKSAFSETVVNSGKEALNVTTAWTITLAATGAAWDSIYAEWTYEDFVPYLGAGI
jgi:hypothetical protein